MTSITLRQLDEPVTQRLRLRAARHGTSVEDEARTILVAALAEPEPADSSLLQAIRRRFVPIGGVELELPPRDSM